MAHIFISYASPDRAIADEVSGWLRAAGHEPFLDHDLRDGIRPGEDWQQRLHHELRRADAVIGVVTKSFVASKWCFAELGITNARGCKLIPLRAEAGVVHPLMQDLQYVEYHADAQQARTRVLQTLRLLDGGGGTWKEGDNPFPGLEPFTAALSQVFFGRAAEAREVGNRLRAMGGTGGLLAVIGHSGCGKSSLLHAAVGPLLTSDPAWLVAPTLVPGTDPLPELARALAVTATRLEVGWSANDVRGRLDAGSDGLRRVADDLLAACASTQQRRLLVMIDQAEELFTRTTSAALQRFAQLLRDAVAGPVQVVAALRSEFLDDLRALPALVGMPIEVYVVAPLDREMLREVIKGPAKVARLRLDNGLTTALVADTDSGEALPLLAFTLHKLADGLPAAGTLSLSRYRDLGGVQGALARHADAVLTQAVDTSGLTDHDILAGLTRLVTVDDTGRRGRRRIKLTGLPEPLRVALQVFVERRLLLSGTDDDGQVWLTVAHEALLTGWQPLDTATADIIAALRTARAVEQAAVEWNSADRPEHYLWDDKRLTTALATLGMADDSDSRESAASPIVEIDDQARAFLNATAQRVHAVKERERRRRTRTIAVLSTLLLLVTAAAIVAFHQRGIAQTQRNNAIVSQITIQADRLRSTDVSLAAQLALTGYLMQPTPDLDTALITTGNAVLSTPLTGHTKAVHSVVFSPDGRILASGGSDYTVRLWNVADPARPVPLGQPLTGHTNDVRSVVFSPDGRILASGGDDDTVRLWNVADPGRPVPLGQPLTVHSNSVVFSPDGHILASGGSDDTVRLWDMADPARPVPLGQPLTGHADDVRSVVFSPDGRILASGSEDGRVQLWDVVEPARPTLLGQPLTGHTSGVNSVVFDPDGRIVASGSGDTTVRLWNVADPARPTLLGQPLTGHTGFVDSVRFTPDGRALASGSGDNTVRLSNIPDSLLTGHTSAVNSVVFSPDGGILASGGSDNMVRLWDVADPARPVPLGQPLTGHADDVRSVVFSPDGRILASGSEDGRVQLWDVADPARPVPLGQPLTGHADDVRSVVFSPDGRILASGDSNYTVQLWDVADPVRAAPLGQPLSGHNDYVNSVVFSPDGRILASGGDDAAVRLWDVADPVPPAPLGQPPTGHTSFVNSVVFSPDGRILASGGSDYTVRLWDVADPVRPVTLGQPLTGHTSFVNSVVFSPDGRILASGGDDATVRLWGRNVDQAIRRICATTGNSLTLAMWKQYVSPDLPYRPPCRDYPQ